ncbi:MAG: SurA N-terminal domain-containing protein, partial [Bacteroidales bacterium]|nr:SurA N-terminal domain-containing protein [Bacteroidales bacterium]
MAAIGKIRKHSGLLIAFIGIALAAFVLGDLFKSRGQGGRKNVPVGVVNGEEISFQEFNKKAEQNLKNARQNNQSGNLSERQRFSIKQETWNQMVKKIIMKEQYQELGVGVSSDELYDMVQGPDPHPVIKRNFSNPNTNEFDPSRVRQFLSNLDQMNNKQRQQWFSLESFLKESRRETKFNNLITKSHYTPDSLAKLAYLEKGKTADADYFGIKYQTVEDSEVSISEEDYKEYYNNHKERFKNENEKRKIEYVVFDVEASEEDRRQIEKQVNDLNKELETIERENIPRFVNSVSDEPYDSSWKSRGDLPARIENTMFSSEPGAKVGPYIEDNAYHIAKLVDITQRPDSMKASHVLIAYQGANRAQDVTRSRQEAQQLADSLLTTLQNNPEQFETLAREYSDGPSGQKGGDLGWFEDGSMAPAFNNAVINNDIGDIVMAETPFGYHIIKVADKKEPVKKVRVAHIVREIKPSNQTYQDVYMKANAFAGENQTYEKFNNAI